LPLAKAWRQADWFRCGPLSVKYLKKKEKNSFQKHRMYDLLPYEEHAKGSCSSSIFLTFHWKENCKGNKFSA
jgi:hypothetical protein